MAEYGTTNEIRPLKIARDSNAIFIKTINKFHSKKPRNR